MNLAENDEYLYNTELYIIHNANADGFHNLVKRFPASMLLKQLEYTVQYDILRISDKEWNACEENKVFRGIIAELQRRLSASNKPQPDGDKVK